MTTDPGDLVLDPTCGSGTTAYVAEQWGRRWITIDTSRVALALARARIMGARYPFYLLADSREGQRKEAEITRPSRPTSPRTTTSATALFMSAFRTSRSNPSPTTPRSMSSGSKWQQTLEPLREQLNKALKTEMAGMGNPPRGRQSMAEGRQRAARAMVGSPHRPPEGD